jgi:histidinol-phosphate aminotransferase
MTIEDFVLNPHILTMPPYTPEKTLEELQEEYGLETIVDLGSIENPLGPSPLAMEAVRRAATDTHLYSSINVAADQLRCKLAESMGPNFHKDNIILGNGSVDVLRMAAEVFLYGGGESIMRRNAFPMYEVATKMYGGECVFIESNKDYTFDLLSMADRITDQTRLVFLTNPNNPTGEIVTQQELDEFMKRIPPSVVVILDHAYQEYVEAEEYPDVAKYILDGRNVIVTRTFSKIYGLAGLRIGYGIARKEIIEYLSRSRMPFYSGSVAPMAAIAALDDVEHVKLSRRLNAEGKKYLYQKFDELDLTHLPTQAFFILLVDLKHDTNAISQALLRRGVIVRPGHVFNMPEAICVTVGKPEDNERMVEALRLVLEELEGDS